MTLRNAYSLASQSVVHKSVTSSPGNLSELKISDSTPDLLNHNLNLPKCPGHLSTLRSLRSTSLEVKVEGSMVNYLLLVRAKLCEKLQKIYSQQQINHSQRLLTNLLIRSSLSTKIKSTQ